MPILPELQHLPIELLIFLLYAETHYKFKGIYSRFKKQEPEIIADTPHRIEPGLPLPIFLLIKDADKYPITLDTVQISVDHADRSFQKSFRFSENISVPFWSKALFVDLPGYFSEHVSVNVRIEINGLLGQKTYHNDNYRISSHAPFAVYLAKEKLPAESNWFFGDLHTHSNYTSDQVEFGAPMSAIVKAARAIGLRFVAVTDHSYDLDDHFDNYLKNHPGLPKWNAFLREVNEMNSQNSAFAIIPGEEVSCGNGHNRNIHFLIFNSPEFFKGYGDSAERWFRTRPQLRATEILDRLPEGALAYAAHPEIMPPFLQRVLISRGRWLTGDYQHSRLNGMQILNGERDKWFEHGVQKWAELLLEGQKLYIIAGNDAHGNFNRSRQIRTPFFTMEESHKEILGKCRTGLLMENGFSQNGVQKALKNGNAIITDGPFASFKLVGAKKSAVIGEEIVDQNLKLEISAKSTPEFGRLKRVTVYCGDLEEKKESEIFQNGLADYSYQQVLAFPLQPVSKGYVRLEVLSQKGEKTFRCLTNPVWFRTGLGE